MTQPSAKGIVSTFLESYGDVVGVCVDPTMVLICLDLVNPQIKHRYVDGPKIPQLSLNLENISTEGIGFLGFPSSCKNPIIASFIYTRKYKKKVINQVMN